MSQIKARAEASRHKQAAFGTDLKLEEFSRQGGAWDYDPDYRNFSPEERSRLLTAGIELTDDDHAATFLQADKAVVHCQTRQPGVEVLPITEAVNRHDWVKDYLWGLVAVDADKYTARAELELDNGYFIRALEGQKIAQPVETCLYLRTDRFAQHVHNLVVVEEGAELHIITGCATHPGVRSGLHIGVSEFYVKKGGQLTFTMIHNWGEDVHVRPRTAVMVEEGGRYISNYILLRPVKTRADVPHRHLKRRRRHVPPPVHPHRPPRLRIGRGRPGDPQGPPHPGRSHCPHPGHRRLQHGPGPPGRPGAEY